jgi:flagellar hook assembly protein FlgD
MVAGGRNGKLVCYSGGLNAPVGVSKHQMSPDKMHGQAYPNPFHSQTNIQLNLPETTTVTLRIVDINGKTIWLHEYVQLQKGAQQLMWNGTDTEGNRMPQGIYLYELRYGTKVSTGRLILIP